METWKLRHHKAKGIYWGIVGNEGFRGQAGAATCFVPKTGFCDAKSAAVNMRLSLFFFLIVWRRVPDKTRVEQPLQDETAELRAQYLSCEV